MALPGPGACPEEAGSPLEWKNLGDTAWQASEEGEPVRRGRGGGALWPGLEYSSFLPFGSRLPFWSPPGLLLFLGEEGKLELQEKRGNATTFQVSPLRSRPEFSG